MLWKCRTAEDSVLHLLQTSPLLCFSSLSSYSSRIQFSSYPKTKAIVPLMVPAKKVTTVAAAAAAFAAGGGAAPVGGGQQQQVANNANHYGRCMSSAGS